MTALHIARTPEREALLEHHYPAGTRMPEIVRLINELPGGKMQRWALYSWAAELELRRPDKPPPPAAVPKDILAGPVMTTRPKPDVVRHVAPKPRRSEGFSMIGGRL